MSRWRAIDSRTIAIVLVLGAPRAYAQIPVADVAIAMANASGTRVPLDTALVAVGGTEHVVRAGDDLRRLLDERGIFPNGDAYSLVYALNPALDSQSLPVGSTILLPTVRAPAAVRQRLLQGFRFYVRPDVTVKRRIVRHALELRESASGLEDRAEGFGPTEAWRAFVASTGQIRDFAHTVATAIDRGTRPVDGDVLSAVDDALALALEIVRPFFTNGGAPSAADLATLRDIATDTRVRSSYWGERLGAARRMDPYIRVPVRVRTRRASAGTADSIVSGLKVYFVPPFYHNRRRPEHFDDLTSPSTRRLPLATYRIWAGTTSDTAALTDVIELELSPDDSLRIIPLTVRTDVRK